MATLALGPVSAAVFAKLSADATLSGLATGGVVDDVPQAATFPFVWYEVNERERRGLGTGGLPEVELRVHVFSTYPGAKEAQTIADRVVEVLKDRTLTIDGFDHCGEVCFYDETTLLPDEEVNGVKCREMVALFRIYAEQTS